VTPSRPYPWAALVGALGEARFEEIRTSLAGRSRDAADRDAFVLDAAVGRVLRELVPDDAPADAVTSYAGLLHALYLHWAGGRVVRTIDARQLRGLLEAPAAPAEPMPGTTYLQLPERLVWAAPASGAPHEPVDGLFVTASPRAVLVLAVLGFRPEREGFTTIEASSPLPAPAAPARDDATGPFSTQLPGGERMGFLSVASEAELVALALLALPESAG